MALGSKLAIRVIFQVTPHFFLLIVIEALVRRLQRKSFPRTNDSISSISNGIMMELSRLVTGSFEIISYIWVYNNFCVINFHWNSAVTWWLAFLAVDFGYYWFHRMAHGKWQFVC